MTEDEFQMLHRKLDRIVHFAFVDIRSFALAGETKRIYDLADVAELIPEFLARRLESDLDAIYGGLEEYADKYGGHAARFINILKMDDDAFTESYCRTHCEWPEPVESKN